MLKKTLSSSGISTKDLQDQMIEIFQHKMRDGGVILIDTMDHLNYIITSH